MYKIAILMSPIGRLRILPGIDDWYISVSDARTHVRNHCATGTIFEIWDKYDKMCYKGRVK